MARELKPEDMEHLLVIVPHQDDEILLGGGLLYELLLHKKRVTVVIVTNGDNDCTDYTKGRKRLRETLAGLSTLGVSQENVIFLGYADTGMAPEDSFLMALYRTKDGDKVICSPASSVTYGLEEKEDFHYQCFGRHGTYCKNTLLEDLRELFRRKKPDVVLTTHGADKHGDHEALFYFVRDVLKELREEVSPRLFVGMVHSPQGDETWPMRDTLFYTCPKGLRAKGLDWEKRYILPLPRELSGGLREGNLKYEALKKYELALEPNAIDYLLSFIKDEEIFWEIDMKRNKAPIYPLDAWKVTEEAFTIENNYRNETTFALSNGYIGTRGTMEEAYEFDVDTGMEGNFINGFYESSDIRYGEANFGSPLKSQTLLNLPNLKETRVTMGGETFSLLESEVSSYSRTLFLREGVVRRSLIWTTREGKRLQMDSLRLVSFDRKHIMAQRMTLRALNFAGEVEVNSRLNARVENHTRKTNPIVDYGPFGPRLIPNLLAAKEGEIIYRGTTIGSGLTMGCGFLLNTLPREAVVESSSDTGELEGVCSLRLRLEKGKAVILDKFMAYASCLDKVEGPLEEFLQKELEAAAKIGMDELISRQKNYVEDFWSRAAIQIEGENALSIIQGLNFNLFHIFQGAGRDGRCGMPAKALTGEGYEGHYFWDTEMYMLPLFIYTQPEVARALLTWRFHTLEPARERAKVMGHPKGALFPWRTINGEEASTYYPLGSAQYHINADISYALSLYVQVTGDEKFMIDMGAEILMETARVWADVGSFCEKKGGRYCICCVTGPDEYNVLVDNNFYTNLMARENLRDAVEAVRFLKEKAPWKLAELKARLEFADEELVLWEKIIEKMYLPYDEGRQIYPMDDGFMMRKPWDESRIPPQKRSWLYENYHPLFIMRHRMSKQADAILGFYLHNDCFSEEEIQRNYDFYQEVTLHHSSLSTCIFGIVASDIGYHEEAYDYFKDSARMDLDDYHNNFYAGIHGANMAGTWQALVNGFAGMRMHHGRLSFKPHLPRQWTHLTFRVQYKGSVIQVDMEQERVQFTLLSGNPVLFYLKRGKAGEKALYLEKGETINEKI
ncbi:MAG: PIG-L family deacetylase [Lachnospiraceae bacterium]